MISRRHVSPTKSAPTSSTGANHQVNVQSSGNDRSEYLEPLKKPKSEVETAISRLNAPTKTHWEELIGELDFYLIYIKNIFLIIKLKLLSY